MLQPSQPQQQSAPAQGPAIAPTQGAAPQGASPQQPQAGAAGPQQGQPQTSNGQYDPGVEKKLEQHLNSLPKQQQAFINAYLTPETVTLLGIVAGAEVYDYFKKFVDPNKMAVVVPRNQQQGGGQAVDDDQQAENAQSSSQDGGQSNAAQGPAGGSPPSVAPTQS